VRARKPKDSTVVFTDDTASWIKNLAIYGINVEQHQPVEVAFFMRIAGEWRRYTGTVTPADEGKL